MRRYLKPALLILVALALVCSLAACNREKEPTDDTPPPTAPTPTPESTPDGFGEAKQLTGVKLLESYGDTTPVALYYNEAEGKVYLQPDYRSELEREGKAFVGIFNHMDGGQMLFDSECKLTITEGDQLDYWMGKMKAETTGWDKRMALYAIFTDSDWVLQFDALGGTGMESVLTVPYGADLTAKLPVPTKPHATFLGWKDAEGNMVTDEHGMPLDGYKTLTVKSFERTVLLEATNSFEKDIEAVVLTAVYSVEKIPVTVINELGNSTVFEFDYGVTVTERDFNNSSTCGYSFKQNSDQSFGAFVLTEPTTVYQFVIRKLVRVHVGDLRVETLSITKSTSSWTPLKIGLTDGEGYTFEGWYSDAAYQNPVSPYVQYATVLSDYYVKLIPVTR